MHQERLSSVGKLFYSSIHSDSPVHVLISDPVLIMASTGLPLFSKEMGFAFIPNAFFALVPYEIIF